MNKKTEFNIGIMELQHTVWVAGRDVRVKHGTPECFPTINALIEKFISENTPSQIRDKVEPVKRVGMCIDHVYSKDIIEFTYITGVQVNGPVEQSKLPGSTKCYAIPAGKYACIKVSSPDIGTTLGIAYTQLEKWLGESQEWESTTGEYEIYPDICNLADMELWRPVKRKHQYTPLAVRHGPGLRSRERPSLL